MPEHAKHVEQNQERHPENKNYFPVDPNGEETRKARLHDMESPGEHPVSKEKLMRDEKTLAMQDNPHADRTTTVKGLPHYESGGHRSIGEQQRYEERKAKWEAENPGREYREKTPKNPDGSVRSKPAHRLLASNIG